MGKEPRKNPWVPLRRPSDSRASSAAWGGQQALRPAAGSGNSRRSERAASGLRSRQPHGVGSSPREGGATRLAEKISPRPRHRLLSETSELFSFFLLGFLFPESQASRCYGSHNPATYQR